MIAVERMLLIGATQKHIGKTSFTVSLIRNMVDRGEAVAAAKITVIRGDKKSSRGWVVDAEQGEHPHKDTGRMFSAGAQAVYWVRCEERFMKEALTDLLERTQGMPLVAESNSIRHVVEPSLFVIIRPEVENNMKPTAEAVLSYPHREIVASSSEDGTVSYTPDLVRSLSFTEGRWIID